jgi:hypothetical protein
MKQLITATLTVMFLNFSLAANATDSIKPTPEVIKCEESGSCEMTEIEKLPKPKKEKKTDKK